MRLKLGFEQLVDTVLIASAIGVIAIVVGVVLIGVLRTPVGLGSTTTAAVVLIVFGYAQLLQFLVLGTPTAGWVDGPGGAGDPRARQYRRCGIRDRGQGPTSIDARLSSPGQRRSTCFVSAQEQQSEHPTDTDHDSCVLDSPVVATDINFLTWCNFPVSQGEL